VRSYQVLNPAEELPIQVEGDGRQLGEEVRLKYRYLDLRRQRLGQMLRLRSRYFQALRQQLYQRQFTEVETPLLTKSTKEGARDFVVPSRFQPGKFYALPQSPQQYKQLLMAAGVERYFQFARAVRDEDLRADRGFEHTQLDLEMSFVSQQEVMSMVEEVVTAAVQEVGGQIKDSPFPVIEYDDALKRFGDDKFDLRSEDEKSRGVLAFTWVTKFPFFKKVDRTDAAETADSKSGWTFTHNPFSQPLPESLADHLAGRRLDGIVSAQYDLVCNGYEVGGGSIRAHRPEVLRATFANMGYSDRQIEENVGHMLTAFKTGTPPHGGIALGLDRHVMILLGESSLKEVIAFPMTSTGRTAVMDAPSDISDQQLSDLGLELAERRQSAHDAILKKLADHRVAHQYLEHQPVSTSREAAQLRGTALDQSAKALVLQADGQFLVYVLPGDQRADLEHLRAALGARKVAMASKDSVLAKTGLEVGSIPPFGSVLGLPTYVDERVAKLEEIAFNVAALDRSAVIKTADYLRLESHELLPAPQT